MEISDAIYKGATILLGLISSFGFISNSWMIMAVKRHSKNQWLPINLILVNSEIGNLLVAIFGIPLSLVSAIHGGWYWSDTMCLGYAWFMSTLNIVNIGNLAAMGIQLRSLAVELRFYDQMFVTRARNEEEEEKENRTVLLDKKFCFVWLYSMILTILPFTGWGNYGYEIGNISCSIAWMSHDPRTRNPEYISFRFFFGIMIPLTVILWAYCDTIQSLKKVKKRTGTLRRHVNLTNMVAVMTIAFLVARTPYAALAFASQYYSFKPSIAMAVLFDIFAKSSICFNAIIYARFNAQFIKSLKKLNCQKKNDGERFELV